MFGIDDALIGAVVGGGLNMVGDMVSQSNARDAFRSRYQDTVADMRKAGLNPALAYGQGGGNPQTMSYGDWGSSATSAAQAIAAARQAKANAEKTMAETSLLNAQRQDLVNQVAIRNTLLNRQAEAAGSSADLNTARTSLANYDITQRKRTLESDIAAALASNEQTRLQSPEARARAKFYDQTGPASFYVSSATDIAKTAAQIYGARGLNKPRVNIYNRLPR